MSQIVKTNMSMIPISGETAKPLGSVKVYLALNANHTAFSAT